MFKSYEEIEEYLKGDKIKCLECGASYKMLGNHLLAKHGISADDYRTQYGIPHSFALYGKGSLEKMSTQMKERLIKDPKYKEQMIKNIIAHQVKPNSWVKSRIRTAAELKRWNDARHTMTKEKFSKILEEMKRSRLSPKEYLQSINYSRQWFTKMTVRFGLEKEVEDIYNNLPFQKLHVEKQKLVNADLIKKIHETVKIEGQRGAARILGVSYHTVHRVINKKRGH